MQGEPEPKRLCQDEIYEILGEQFPIEDKMSAKIHDLVYVEVMKFDKTYEEREHTNDRSTLERQPNRQ